MARFARGRGRGAPGRASERLCRNVIDDDDIRPPCPRSGRLVRGDGTLVPRPARPGGSQLVLEGEREEFAGAISSRVANPFLLLGMAKVFFFFFFCFDKPKKKERER